MMPLNTFLSSTRFPPRSLGNKGRMPSTCSALSPNNWAITHLLLVLSWGSLSTERVIPHIMSPDPRVNKIEAGCATYGLNEEECKETRGKLYKLLQETLDLATETVQRERPCMGDIDH